MIDLEGSAARFMERIGVRSQGYDFYTFKKQMKAIAAASFNGLHGQPTAALNCWHKPVSRFEAWTTTEDGQGSLWPAEMELSQDYYDDLLRHAVPLDARAMIALEALRACD